MHLRVAAALLAAIAPAAQALDYHPLQGDYALGGKTLIDAPAGEARDTHLYLELAGAAARDVYRALKAKAQPDACGDPGDLIKRAGAIACTRTAHGSEFRCTFDIELGAQRLVDGGAC